MVRWFGKKQPETTSGEKAVPPFPAELSGMPDGPQPGPSPVPGKPAPPAPRPTAEAVPRAIAPQDPDAVSTPRTVPMGGKEAGPHPKALYKQLMNSFYDAILIADGKGHVVDTNQRAADFFGFSSEELWDMPAAQLVSGLNAAVYERIRRAIGSDRFVLMNTRCQRKDGSKFPAEVGISMVALLGQENYVFTVRNIERRSAQLRSLRAGQNAFMNALSGCFLCDAAQNLVAANNAFLTLLHLSPTDPIVGEPIGRFLPVVAEHFAAVAGGEPRTFEGLGADGTTRFTIQLAPNRQGASQIDGLVGSVLPIRT